MQEATQMKGASPRTDILGVGLLEWKPRIEEDDQSEWMDLSYEKPGELSVLATYCTKPEPGEECDRIFWMAGIELLVDGYPIEHRSEGWVRDSAEAIAACRTTIVNFLLANEV